MRTAAVLALALAGCSFTPGSYNAGDSGTPLDDARRDQDDTNMVVIDAMVDAPPDAQACFGAGIGAVCLMTPPTEARTLSGDFDTGGSTCDEVIDGRCVLTATAVTVAGSTVFRAHGSRPLIIVSSGNITIEGTIDVSSNAGGSGPGASTATCNPLASNPENDAGGAGGGAGGSFAAKGGNGARGDNNNNGLPLGSSAGAGAAAIIDLTAVRAGCPGSQGGSGMSGGTRGTGGAGGGAVYLIAGGTITISGVIHAGGRGGNGSSEGNGGGGGGSGGLIGLDAPMVVSSGILAANGGGGGGGGTGNGTVAQAGGNAMAAATAAGGGDGAGNDGGDGGLGSSMTVLTGATPGNGNGGGGGGGGGAGYVYVKGMATLAGVVSPPATLDP